MDKLLLGLRSGYLFTVLKFSNNLNVKKRLVIFKLLENFSFFFSRNYPVIRSKFVVLLLKYFLIFPFFFLYISYLFMVDSTIFYVLYYIFFFFLFSIVLNFKFFFNNFIDLKENLLQSIFVIKQSKNTLNGLNTAKVKPSPDFFNDVKIKN